jgi:hypothetical protein
MYLQRVISNKTYKKNFLKVTDEIEQDPDPRIWNTEESSVMRYGITVM